jgi:Mrp family chromosome partitioning ATPase
MATPAKKSAAKKTTAKKTPAKKTATTKKTAAKKPAAKPSARASAPPSAPASEAIQRPDQANHFELRRGGTSITYDATSKTGKPLLTYDDGTISRSFSGDEIQTVPTTIGTLLTVDVEFIPDAESKAVTVVLPQVNLKDNKPRRFRTVVLFTTIRSSFVGPGLVEGAVQTYTARTFRGTASFVVA